MAGSDRAGPASAQTPPVAPNAQQPVKDLSPAVIRPLRHSLIHGGYEVDASDGVWGPKTAAAVRELQRVRGLQPTGQADPQTLAALGVVSNGTSPPSRASGSGPPPLRQRSPADLDRTTNRAIQQDLGRHGSQVGAADGSWGERTADALRALQRARGLDPASEVDVHTLAALDLLPADGSSPG